MIFTINSCGSNDKVVFLRRKDLNTEDYERFYFKKRVLGIKCGTRSSFKGFVMLVVMMLMMASSAMAEVIDGLRYVLDHVKKTATLLPKKEGKYSGDIIIPEKVKGNDGVEYVVTSDSAVSYLR